MRAATQRRGRPLEKSQVDDRQILSLIKKKKNLHSNEAHAPTQYERDTMKIYQPKLKPGPNTTTTPWHDWPPNAF